MTGNEDTREMAHWRKSNCISWQKKKKWNKVLECEAWGQGRGQGKALRGGIHPG